MSVTSSVYAFVDDFVDAGAATVAQDLAAKGFSSVSLATVYHAARDFLPHNPKRAVVHRTEGVHYFPPARELYTGSLTPAAVETGTAQFGDVTAALATHGLDWQAWTVYLHNCRLATAHPECAVVNAFGDRYITDLCPSSEAVSTYAAELTADVAQRSPSLIVAESLHHAGFGHGYHHERSFVDIPAAAQSLLALCFCASCVDRAAAHDVDAAALAVRVRAAIRELLGQGTSTPGFDVDRLVELCGDELAGYIEVRTATVTALVTRCSQVARDHGVPFGFIDLTGAVKGYATGEPGGAVAADDAWQLGISPASVAEVVDAYVVLAYAREAARVADDVAAYQNALGNTAQLRCVLRHGGPDYLGRENLAEKVRAAREHGAGAIDFYHYGLMTLDGLAAAAAALHG